MSSRIVRRLRAEAQLIERFTAAYRRKLHAVIDRLNASPEATDLQCVRLCVEAVDMILASQSQMAQAIDELAEERDGPAEVEGREVARAA